MILPYSAADAKVLAAIDESGLTSHRVSEVRKAWDHAVLVPKGRKTYVRYFTSPTSRRVCEVIVRTLRLHGIGGAHAHIASGSLLALQNEADAMEQMLHLDLAPCDRDHAYTVDCALGEGFGLDVDVENVDARTRVQVPAWHLVVLGGHLRHAGVAALSLTNPRVFAVVSLIQGAHPSASTYRA